MWYVPARHVGDLVGDVPQAVSHPGYAPRVGDRLPFDVRLNQYMITVSAFASRTNNHIITMTHIMNICIVIHAEKKFMRFIY